MAEDAVFTVRIEEIAAGGAGLARRGGKPVFVEGSAPGELVACRLSEERRSWARAELLEIAEASPERIEPRCGLCGGCNLQHIRYEAQLAAKTAILKTAFERIGGFTPPEPAVFPSQPWEYRNRMQFHRINGRQGAAFGLKARRSGSVPVADCPIADPGIREALWQSAEGRAAIIPPPGTDRFTVYARGGLFLSEGGKRRGQVTLLNRSLTLDAGLFFQSNGAMLERLIVDLRDIAAAGDGLMADLYCGVGTFACFLSDLFPRIELVEKNKSALALARENIAATGALAAECFALSGDEWAALKTGAPCRFIVVDPPRQGLSPSLSAWLAAKGPPLLAYVSCDSATLARDSILLRRGGYDLTELRLYDFYPQTAHIESLAVFRK